MSKAFVCATRLVAACLAVTCAANTATAQARPAGPVGSVVPEGRATQRDGGFHFGFTGGPEFTHVDIKLDDGNQSLELVVGFHLGIALAWSAGPFVIRTGVNFVNSGALFNGTSFLARDEFDVSFLTVPLDFRLAPVRRGMVRPYIFAGPEIRYGLDLEERPISLTNDIRMLDAAVSVGVGVSIRARNLPIVFSPEIRYVTDLFGIYHGELETDDGGFVQTAEAVKANVLRVGVLLGF